MLKPGDEGIVGHILQEANVFGTELGLPGGLNVALKLNQKQAALRWVGGRTLEEVGGMRNRRRIDSLSPQTNGLGLSGSRERKASHARRQEAA